MGLKQGRQVPEMRTMLHNSRSVAFLPHMPGRPAGTSATQNAAQTVFPSDDNVETCRTCVLLTHAQERAGVLPVSAAHAKHRPGF